jgi:hypothetical protein
MDGLPELLESELFKLPAAELATGVLTGVLAFGGICIPKAILTVIGWLSGTAVMTELINGVVDLGLGGAVLYDVNTRPKDDFWKGVEWSFGVLEVLFGTFAIGSAIAAQISGGMLENPYEKFSRSVVEFLTGKKYEK